VEVLADDAAKQTAEARRQVEVAQWRVAQAKAAGDPVAIREGWLAVIDAAAHLVYTAGGSYLNLAGMNGAIRDDILAAIDTGHAADEALKVADAPTRTPRAIRTGYFGDEFVDVVAQLHQLAVH
jgi:hypothetical protein